MKFETEIVYTEFVWPEPNLELGIDELSHWSFCRSGKHGGRDVLSRKTGCGPGRVLRV
jgi:hypothetical protein